MNNTKIKICKCIIINKQTLGIMMRSMPNFLVFACTIQFVNTRHEQND